MMRDSNYTNQLKCRWQNLRATVLDKQHIYSIIDSIANILNESKIEFYCVADTWNLCVAKSISLSNNIRRRNPESEKLGKYTTHMDG